MRIGLGLAITNPRRAPAAAPPPAPGGVTWGDHQTGITLSNGDATATGDVLDDLNIRTSTSKNTGKWKIEYQITDGFGDLSGDLHFGYCLSTFDIENDTFSTAFYSVNGVGSPPALEVNNGQVAAAYVDIDAGKVWFEGPGGLQQGDPVAGTDPSFTFDPGAAVYGYGAIFGEPGSEGVITLASGNYSQTGYVQWAD